MTGNNVYQGKRSIKDKNILAQGGSQKNVFKTEYQRKFDKAAVSAQL